MSRGATISVPLPLPGADATHLACSLGVSPHYRQEELQRWLSAASIYEEMHPEESLPILPSQPEVSVDFPLSIRQRSQSQTLPEPDFYDANFRNGFGGRRRSAFDAQSLSLHKVSTFNRSCASTNPASRGESSLELEAIAAVHELSFAVDQISVSEMLPRTPDLIFVNVTTVEGHPYCLELTLKGWRITSVRHDCMIGDFTRLELFTKYYDSLYDLMGAISPGYHALFEEKIATKLRSLETYSDEEPATPQVTTGHPVFT